MTQFTIIIVYLALLLGLGLFASRAFTGTKKDYMLASHSIGPFLLLMSLFGTTMTAFALVGSTGEAFKEGIGVYGMLASSSGIIHSLCFFVIGVKIWNLGRKYGYSTQIQFFRDRLESDKIGLLLFPILVGLIIPYLLVGVISAGTVMQNMTSGAFDLKMFQTDSPATSGGVPPWIGSLLICIVVLIYVFFGGMRGTAWANAFQTIVFMILGLVTFVVIANKLGSGGAIDPSKDNVISLYELEQRELEVAKIRGKGEVTPEAEAAAKTLAAERWALIESLNTNEDEAITEAEKPGLLTALHIATSAASEEKITRVDMSKMKFFTYLLIPLSVGMFPHLFQHWLTAKSADSFKLPVIVHPIFIMIVWVPCVLMGIWATTKLIPSMPSLPENPNAVLPFLVKTQTSEVLGGLLTAGILAAIMSSLDSQFLCIGTIFENDLVTHYLGKDRFSDSQQVWITRGFIIAIVAVTYGLSLLEPRSVFTLGVWCFTGFSSLFPIVFAALYWPKLTKYGTYAAILAMVASWGFLFWQSELGANRTYTVDIAGYQTMPVVTTFLCTLVTMVVVSLLTPLPSQETLNKFFPQKDAA